MQDRRQFLQSATALALSAPALSFGQGNYKAEYRLSLVSGPGTIWYQSAERFTRLVDEQTQGRIKMKMFPGSSLVQGQQDRELVALRQGLIDVLVGPAVNWSGTLKDLALFSLPFLMTNERAVDAVLASDALNKDFYAIMRHGGVEPLASAEYGYVQLLNSKRRVVVPEDLKGMKIRTVATPMQQELMSSLGANPTSMSFAEVQPALASGAVDGMALTIEQFVAFKLHSVGLRHVTKWNAMNELTHFAVSNAAWRNWSPEDQRAVRAAAQTAAREMTANVRKANNGSDDQLRTLGVDVQSPSKDQIELWQTHARRVYARWKASINLDVATKLEQAMATAAKA